MWESGKSSGFLSLLSHDVKVKLATAYFGIASHNYEAVKVRDVGILAETTKAEKPKIDVKVEQGDQTTSPHVFDTSTSVVATALCQVCGD
jgi:hypothetical protein